MTLFLDFHVKKSSWGCLFGSGLKLIFHWKGHSFIVFKSLFKSLAELCMSWTTENREVSSANSLAFEEKPWGCKSKIIMNLILNLEKLLHLAQSKKMFAHLGLLFVSCFPKNQLKVSVNFLIFHSEIVWKETLHVKLYQRLLGYLERQSSLQVYWFKYFMFERY